MPNLHSEATELTKRLLSHLSVETSDIKKIVLLTLGMGLLSIATPIAIQALVNVVTMGGVMSPLYVISFMLFLVLILSGVFKVLENYIVELIQRRFFVRMALQSAKNVQASQVSIHDENNYVELMNRFFDVSTVQKAGAILLTTGLTSLLKASVGSIILMFYSFYFAIAVVLIILAILFVIKIIGRHALETAINDSKTKYAMAGWLETLARNLSTFKFSGGNHFAQTRTDALANEYLIKRKKHFKVLLAQNISGILIYALAGTGMLALGGALVINGQINLGQFVAAELIIFAVLTSFQRFIGHLEYYYDLMAALDKLSVLESFPIEPVGSHQLDIKQGLNLNVANISHRYTANIQPINNISFQLNAGKSLAILGGSGTGKTTLADLITGLRTVNSGYIEYNGIDIRQIDMQTLRQHIGLASKIDIIDGSIYENIALGRQDISLETVSQILAKLGFLEQVLALDEGLSTPLTASGAPLSHAQTALLVLARAMACKPHLLIIDSLLDGLEPHLLEEVCTHVLAKERHYGVIILTRFSHIAKRCEQILELKTANEVQHGV